MVESNLWTNTAKGVWNLQIGIPCLYPVTGEIEGWTAATAVSYWLRACTSSPVIFFHVRLLHCPPSPPATCPCTSHVELQANELLRRWLATHDRSAGPSLHRGLSLSTLQECLCIILGHRRTCMAVRCLSGFGGLGYIGTTLALGMRKGKTSLGCQEVMD